MVTWEDKIFYQMMLRKGGNNNKRRNLWKTFTDVLKFTKGIQEPGKRADILARVLRKKEKGSKKKKKTRQRQQILRYAPSLQPWHMIEQSGRVGSKPKTSTIRDFMGGGAYGNSAPTTQDEMMRRKMIMKCVSRN